MMKSILKKGLLALALVGAFTACSKDDNNSNASQNYMQGGDRKTEIKFGVIAQGEVTESVNKGWKGARLGFMGPGLSITPSTGGSTSSDISGIGDAFSVDIEMAQGDLIPGTYQFGSSSTLKVAGMYIIDYDDAASDKAEGIVGAYVGEFTKGSIQIEAKGSEYTVRADGECIDKKGVVKKVSLYYQGALLNIKY